MATSRLFLAISLLLLPFLAVLPSAADYGYAPKPDLYKPKLEGEAKLAYDTKPKPDGDEKPSYDTKPDLYKPKPEGDEKPIYDKKPDLYKPKPEGDEKPVYGTKPDGEEKPGYGTKPDIYKPKPGGGKKPGYDTKPKTEGEEKPGYDKKPKPVEEEKPGYDTKPDLYKPKPEGDEKPGYNTKPKPEGDEKPGYDTKPKPEGEEKPGYDTKPDLYKPKPEEDEKPGYNTKPGGDEKPGYDTKPEQFEKPLPVGIEGLILCRFGPGPKYSYSPIQGALARLTCLAVDENGFETSLSVYSKATDEKGYFFATLSSLGLDDKLKLAECKAFLENSPLHDCNVPCDVNKGLTGSLLSNFHVLKEKKIKLYSVGPFFFTPDQKSALPPQAAY